VDVMEEGELLSLFCLFWTVLLECNV